MSALNKEDAAGKCVCDSTLT